MVMTGHARSPPTEYNAMPLGDHFKNVLVSILTHPLNLI